MAEHAPIVPALFYQDPIPAMKWLEKAFGFETTTLLTDADGKLGYAEMAFRGCAFSVGGEFGGELLGGVQMKSSCSILAAAAASSCASSWRKAWTSTVNAPGPPARGSPPSPRPSSMARGSIGPSTWRATSGTSARTSRTSPARRWKPPAA